MTATVEDAFFFECDGESLLGHIARPAGSASRLGVLVIVGGPQYRVGSHRQFVLLARHLARMGISCMRFDYRGMGDSTGPARDFQSVSRDVAAAIEQFLRRCAGLERVVLWGLCDGASAACFHAPGDARVAGAVLLNPWVRTEAGKARAYLRHYYLKRMFSGSFWKKLLGGGVSLGTSFREASSTIRLAGGPLMGNGAPAALDSIDSLPHRMATALRRANKPVLFILSGRDYVAREFEAAVKAGGPWRGIAAAQSPVLLGDADHTFSSAALCERVAALTAEWCLEIDRSPAAHGPQRALGRN